jgi:CheY-like chemotaxis protein
LARKILLADDSVTAQNMGRRILTDAGYEVTTVNNGSAALKKIAEIKPDLIVLDVYMPGYGGLEVCQRMRENKETARLPVLLTVGKLEPFKPDEARRVRADAYIIKPFEASELLTALAKLEDKIVPQPEAYKPGRFAKAIAAVEQNSGESFGDSETGWKERLIIPHPSVKPVEPEPEPVVTAKSGRDKKPAEPKRGFERPIPAGLPEDITAEEIAAITAAAAALNGQPTEPVPPALVGESETSISAEPVVEAAVEQAAVEEVTEEALATFASATQTEAVAEEAASAPHVETSHAEAAKFEEEKAAEAVAEVAEVETQAAPDAVATPEVSAPEVRAASAATDRVLNSDAEVLAALASLGSASDIGSVSSSRVDTSAMQAATSELVAASAFSGPRWIAEVVPLSMEEATFVLEQEMEKQYAAFAAADAVCAALAAGSGSSVSWVSSAVSSAVAVEEAPAPEFEQQHSPVAETSSEVQPQAADVESVSSTAPEFSSSDSGSGTSVVASEEKGEAFAAAAGAHSSVSAVGSVASEAPEQNEADLAAAWANWKQIRGTILGSQTVVPITQTEESAAVEETAAMPEENLASAQSEVAEAVESAPAVAQEESASEADSADDISNMVDNMLAELKPKLMKEIAKKLKKEKR